MSQQQTTQRTPQMRSSSAGQLRTNRTTQIVIGVMIGVVLLLAALVIHGFLPQGSTNPSTFPNAHFSISLSGGLNGQLVTNDVKACGTLQATNGYKIDADGTLNGASYELLILIPTYKQPASYSTAGNHAAATISLTEVKLGSYSWESQGTQGSITVNGNAQSGSFSATLVNAATNAQAQISGTWLCS